MADDDSSATTSTTTSSSVSGVTDASYREVYATFRRLVESADRKFARVRDLPPYGRGPLQLLSYRKVFKAYTSLWHFQQEHRRELVAAGLRRWEIGEIASRIGQLHYVQYLRTSELRFLLGAYFFYEAILNRGYFEAAIGWPVSNSAASKADLRLRYKELRFYARFLVVVILLNRVDAAMQLADRFRALVDQSKIAFPDMNLKEWTLLVHEILRFLKAGITFKSAWPLRYSALYDSHASSVSHIARFHSKRVLKLQDALLTSYHHNEVKFTELTLDNFRMLQCLELEPSGSFYEVSSKETSQIGRSSEQIGASGSIDINLVVGMEDPSLLQNPCKAVIYHPSVSHFLAVLAAICEEMSSESILLIYISASGKAESTNDFQKHLHGSSTDLLNSSSRSLVKRDTSLLKLPKSREWSSRIEGYLYLGSRGNGGPNNLYPEDLIPFTRRPLFLIIDSDNSHAFKILHGMERGEASAILLSHEKPSVTVNTTVTSTGSQFTYFLTAPMEAFCELVGFPSATEADVQNESKSLLSSALAECEVLLYTSKSLDQVWAQVLPDQFLRRLIVRFIFCQAVLYLLRPMGDAKHLPECVPVLPESVSPRSTTIQTLVFRLAEKMGVTNHFQFPESIKVSVQ